jgi:hypothetical protein
MAENLTQQIIGSAKSAIYTPVFTIAANYKILNAQLVRIDTSNGGTITSNANQVSTDLDITTTAGSSASLRAVRVLKYRPGIANSVRFGMIFDTGIANSRQFGGLANDGNQLTFIQNGTDFAVRRTSGGRLEIRTLTITVAENGAATGTVTLAGVAFNVTLSNAGGSISFTAHELGDTFTYTGWITEHINDTISFISSVDVGPIGGTYSYSSTGASTGTFAQTQAGVVETTFDVLQADWNGNSEMVFLLNPQLANAYEIEYTWLGVGNIDFRVLNPRQGKYETVHSMRIANVGLALSLEQPNMFGTISCISDTSTTALQTTASGFSGGSYGNTNIKSPIYGFDNERTIAANTETVILAIANRFVMNGTVNQSEIFLERMSGAIDGNRPVLIKIIKDPTTLGADATGDYTDFQYVNETESLTIIDITSLTYTGGDVIDEFFVGKDGNLTIDYHLRELEVFQRESIIITAESTQTNVVNISLTVLEDS